MMAPGASVSSSSEAVQKFPDSPLGQEQHAHSLILMSEGRIAADTMFTHGLRMLVYVQRSDLNVWIFRTDGFERQTCRFATASVRGVKEGHCFHQGLEVLREATE